MKKQSILLASALALGLMGAGTAVAGEPKVIELKIENHLFHPDRIEVTAGEDFVLLVKNMDAEPEEFESKPLHQEKLIQGHSTGKIRVRGLKAGEYLFVGEFHEDKCKGLIVVK